MRYLFDVAGAMLNKFSKLINTSQEDIIEFRYDNNVTCYTCLQTDATQLQYSNSKRGCNNAGLQIDPIQNQNNNIRGLENIYINDIFRALHGPTPTDLNQNTHTNLTQTAFKRGSILKALKKIYCEKQDETENFISFVLPENYAANTSVRNDERISEDGSKQVMQQHKLHIQQKNWEEQLYREYYQQQQQQQQLQQFYATPPAHFELPKRLDQNNQEHQHNNQNSECETLKSKDSNQPVDPTPEFIDDTEEPNDSDVAKKQSLSKEELVFSYEQPPEVYYHNSRVEHFEGKKADRFFNALKQGLTGKACLSVQKRIIEDGIYNRSYNKKMFLRVIKEELKDDFVEGNIENIIKIIPKVLGEGVNGKVVAGRRLGDNKVVALKTLTGSFHCPTFNPEDILLELSIMSSKNVHRNILRLHNFYFDDTNDKIVLAMDLMTCSLNAFIWNTPNKKLPEEHALHIFNEVTEGLLHLRKAHGVFHNDLKPDNILININGEVKVADFGMAKPIKSLYHVASGTIFYMAPEVADKKKSFGDKSDIWSLGLVLIEMIDGLFKHAPKNMPESQFLLKISRISHPPFSTVLKRTGFLHAFSQRLVAIDPDDRASLLELKQNLKLFTDYNLLQMSSHEQFRYYFQQEMHITPKLT